MHRLAIVVPCYFEQEVLPETTECLTRCLEELIKDRLIAPDSYVLYINDGSTDNTWTLIQQFHESNKYIKGVNLAANVGHQNALLAGLSVAVDCSDIAVTIDADLQDDVNAIREMAIKYSEGYDIVYGVRASRKTDTWFKRTTAKMFYKLMNFMGVKSVYNHADFRLMSKRALEQLLKFRERNMFIRGVVPLVGYRTTNIYYDRAKRFAGESKYPLSKMLAFALDGITSFSARPIHLIIYLGILFILISLGILVWVAYTMVIGHAVQGWASLMLSIWFCSGCLLVGMGIVGEYIGKIYIEVKDRPRYNIEDLLM